METKFAQAEDQVFTQPEQEARPDQTLLELSSLELSLVGGGLGAVSFY
ncbi:MAG: hypothetical protein L6Q72_05805 [Burkholderiaceae bacterium]|nr:hypothetical protein [Burkholderiaceae bacterium]GIL05061.1 MAG: hypothetical protein BroJett031_15810 [Betaproteobacteria bacterium]